MKVCRVAALALLLAGAFGVGNNATAQTTQSVNSTANVVTPITGGSMATLAFGSITKGQTNTIAATTPEAGAFYFSGDEADNITLTVPSSITLTTTAGGGSTLNVALNRGAMKANSSSNVQAQAANADASSGSVTIALSGDAGGDGTNNDGLGQVYIWIGGSVTPTALQQRGDYSGTFTVNASYSN